MSAQLGISMLAATGLLLGAPGCATAGHSAASSPAKNRTYEAATGGGAQQGLAVTADKVKASGSSYRKTVGPRRQRHEIKHADVEIVTSDVAGGLQKAGRLAGGIGGYVVDSSSTADRARISFRVPVARFDEAMRRVRKLGQIADVSIRGEDVTSRVVDLELRLRTAQEVRKRYLELLARASDVAQALPVQKELERITMTVEQLEGQLNLLRHQVAYSTISLELRQPTRPGIVGAVFYGLYRVVRWLFVWD